MTIGDKKVQIAIAIRVEKMRAKAQGKSTGSHKTDAGTGLGKNTLFCMVIKGI